jgi:MATE family multidrug resistance protein
MTSLHYGSPSSLPSDYALLSRYANNANRDDLTDDMHEYTDDNDIQDESNPNGRPIRSVRRRTSCPFPYLQPLQPKLTDHYPVKDSMPDEYTPLLVPRIEEEDDTKDDPDHPPSTAKVYRDEMRILCKYTLPVFGYGLHLHVVLDFG